MKIIQLSILCAAMLLAAGQQARAQLFPYWAEAMQLIGDNCAGITDCEPLTSDNPRQRNAIYTSMIMVYAGAGWCCYQSGQHNDDPCNHDRNWSNGAEVLYDGSFRTDPYCDGDEDNNLWNLIISPSAINSRLSASTKWFHGWVSEGGSVYFNGEDWDNGPGSAVLTGDIIATTDYPAQSLIALGNGADAYACVQQGSAALIRELIVGNIDCRIFRGQGPFGGSTSDQGRLIFSQQDGGQK